MIVYRIISNNINFRSEHYIAINHQVQKGRHDLFAYIKNSFHINETKKEITKKITKYQMRSKQNERFSRLSKNEQSITEKLFRMLEKWKFFSSNKTFVFGMVRAIRLFAQFRKETRTWGMKCTSLKCDFEWNF